MELKTHGKRFVYGATPLLVGVTLTTKKEGTVSKFTVPSFIEYVAT